MPILEEHKLIERKVIVVLCWVGVNGSKLHGRFRRGGEVKTFLSKEI